MDWLEEGLWDCTLWTKTRTNLLLQTTQTLDSSNKAILRKLAKWTNVNDMVKISKKARCSVSYKQHKHQELILLVLKWYKNGTSFCMVQRNSHLNLFQIWADGIEKLPGSTPGYSRYWKGWKTSNLRNERTSSIPDAKKIVKVHVRCIPAN